MKFILSLFLIFQVTVGESEWQGCTFSEDEKDFAVTSGDVSAVCLTVGPGTAWGAANEIIEYNRYTFQPKADEFSHMHVVGSYETVIESNEDKHVFVASQKAISFLRKYYDSSSEFIFPHLTAIIDVKDGIVRGISWDDACLFCREARCVENTFNFAGVTQDLKEPTKGCYFTKTECDKIREKNGTQCDLNLYVVWTGTDKDGKLLTSSNMRFSLFNPKQVRDSLKDALKNSLDAIDIFDWLR